MDDITIRLRRGFGGIVPTVCDEAANEIERLRYDKKQDISRPTKYEIRQAAALLEQLLENFAPIDDDDVDATRAAERVTKWILYPGPKQDKIG